MDSCLIKSFHLIVYFNEEMLSYAFNFLMRKSLSANLIKKERIEGALIKITHRSHLCYLSRSEEVNL